MSALKSLKGLTFSIFLFFVGLPLTVLAVQAALVPDQLNRFDNVFEPSGVIQLADGSLLVAEDETARSLAILKPTGAGGFKRSALVNAGLIDALAGRSHLGSFDDLEGLSSDGQGHVYAITSHWAPKGATGVNRRKLVRLTHAQGALSLSGDPVRLDRLMLAAYPVLKKLQSKRRHALNIEGLAFDRSRQSLLVGLRSPLLKGDALVVEVLNPADIFESGASPQFAPSLISLPLGKGGIRAMEFDEVLGGLIIVSRRETKKNKPWKLWCWPLDRSTPPEQIKAISASLLESVEGVAPYRPPDGNDPGLFFVRDDGVIQKQRGARYFFSSYQTFKGACQ